MDERSAHGGPDLHAGHPVEPQWYPVGRRTSMLVDHGRDARVLPAEFWYPSTDDAATGHDPSRYELMPGISFRSAGALHDAPVRAGRHPFVLFSHGRTGMRFVASMLCEALAARGAVVVSTEHQGDSLLDWLTGSQTDDATNEANRLADAHLVIDAVIHGAEGVPLDITNSVDPTRLVVAGHSYGAYTAFAAAAGDRGVASHPSVRAVVGYQPYTRMMSDDLLHRLDVPYLLVVASADATTPPATDADRPWAVLSGRPAWRLDLEGATHQASTDVALYAELVDQVPGVPDIVRDYLQASAAGGAVVAGRTWRELLRVQVEATWAFLQEALDIDPDTATQEAERLSQCPGLVLTRH